MDLAQASLAAALRDVGIIAELGYAKEERITNERNKSYPDKAIAALVAASTGADEPGAGDHGQAKPQGAAESLPEGHGIAGDGTAGPATTTTQLVNSRDQGQLRVGCIVDIPNSPRIPPMRIGAHLSFHRSSSLWSQACFVRSSPLSNRVASLSCLP